MEYDNPDVKQVCKAFKNFEARRIKGKYGRGAYGKMIVFDLFNREGKVFIKIIPDVKAPKLQVVIRGYIDLNSINHTVMGGEVIKVL